MEETLKQYMNEYYRGFTGFEIEHILDFEKCMIYYKRIGLAEYEKAHLDEDILFPPGDIRIGIRDERNNGSMKTNILMDLAVFTMKLGGENLKRILEKILLGISIEGAAKEGAVVDITKMKDELERLRVKSREDKEKIDILEKEKKIAEERIKSAENDVIKLQEIEKTSEITTSHPVRRKVRQKATISAENPKKKKSSTQEIKKGKITEIPVKTTSDDDYLNKHFAKRSRDLRFYDFPAYRKDEEIYESLKNIGYIERLEVKWNYKYKTVRARIRLTNEMEERFRIGGSNIAIKKNDLFYYFRMFDAKMSPADIKKRYEWQAYKKYNELPGMPEYKALKTINTQYEGHFSKIIKINKIKYVLIYFNNEKDLLKAIYKSTMEETNMENGLKIKSQDELISENGTYKKRFGINRFKIPQQNTKDEFVDAPTDQISTIPRTLEEHEELDKLNINFKGRLEDLEKTPNLPSIKGKKKAVEISDDDDDKEEKTNKNKKRVVRKQGERENSDKE
ncbi:unnamed protein product [Rhizophagus irregularis]|uniref:Uncharacterized protein n=1 Tax=Rhizophagus irregularis TaxID=588596 RepID=A0A2I1HGP7_9GLOM|nr:hypothetical protein RhiirA4_449183 [Rhizophagus irregularis]CAB4432617.1 unnamed protein product [Rhizophagus irregularis]